MTGEQRMQHAKPRLIPWLDDRLRFGFSEWNAPGYYSEDISPLLNLVDFCLDEQIIQRSSPWLRMGWRSTPLHPQYNSKIR